jgi:hypothetical protein
LVSLLRAPEKAAAIGLAAACAAAAAAWLGSSGSGPSNLLMPRGGDNFLFSRPPLTRGAGIAGFFEKMPRDTGIMAPQGLSPEIVYLTDKRVVALPFDPRLLDEFIREYRISYVVTSREYLGRYDKPDLDLYTSRVVTEHLFRNPEKYRPLRTAAETFPAFYPPQEYFVFGVGEAASR